MKDYIRIKEMSLKGISKKYAISYDRVKQVSVEDGWVKQKKERWHRATEEALDEVEGSIKSLISRHSKIARFLQAGGLREIQKKLEAIRLDPSLAEKTPIREFLALIAEGLKAERELYPKQMQFEGDVSVNIGISKELKEAVYETLKRKLRTKPTRKRSAGSK